MSKYNKMPDYARELIPRNELVFDNFDDAMAVLKATTRNEADRSGDYCVLFSREEALYVLDFLYSEHCDRNDVVFMDRGIFDEFYVGRYPEEGEDDDV